MAITWGEAEYLIYLSREKILRGKVATFGRMTMLVTGQEVKRLAKRLNFNADGIAKLPDTTIDDQAFFLALGVDELVSIDAVDIDSPTMIGDLSKTLPEELHGQFDAVLDSGTMEHVANFTSCLENACRLAKVGGHVIHSIPSTNFLDHGYFSISPIFYVDFFAVNRWHHPFMALFDTKWGRYDVERNYWNYTPRLFGRVQWTGQFNRPISVASVVKRLPESTISFEGVIQRDFLPPTEPAAHDRASIVDRMRGFGKQVVRSHPGVFPLLGPLWYWAIARHTLAKTRFRLATRGALPTATAP